MRSRRSRCRSPISTREGYSVDDLRTSVQWTSELLLVALIAGYARRVTGEADRQHSLALDRLGRLSDANALLFSLHRVAQSLPASLDLNEVLDSTMQRVRDLFRFDATVLLLHDDSVAAGRSCAGRAPTSRPHRRLRAAQADAGRTARTAARERARPPARPGLLPTAVGHVRGAAGPRVGRRDDRDRARGVDRFGDRDVELLSGFAEPAGLAVDNARWFARLRTVGADEERTRIARDLHDRIGQSLAYLAFELDRLVRRQGRRVARRAPRALPPRCAPGDRQGARHALRPADRRVGDQGRPHHPARVPRPGRDRSRLAVELETQVSGRLPLLQEREMWRVAQEAVTNVVRHAEA